VVVSHAVVCRQALRAVSNRTKILTVQINIFVCRVLSDENSIWLLDNLIPSLSGSLFALRLLLRSLKDLPDYIIAHSASSHGNKVRKKTAVMPVLVP
jgi:hypothetical protein